MGFICWQEMNSHFGPTELPELPEKWEFSEHALSCPFSAKMLSFLGFFISVMAFATFPSTSFHVSQM
jgi:hypothetical protein